VHASTPVFKSGVPVVQGKSLTHDETLAHDGSAYGIDEEELHRFRQETNEINDRAIAAASQAGYVMYFAGLASVVVAHVTLPAVFLVAFANDWLTDDNDFAVMGVFLGIQMVGLIDVCIACRAGYSLHHLGPAVNVTWGIWASRVMTVWFGSLAVLLGIILLVDMGGDFPEVILAVLVSNAVAGGVNFLSSMIAPRALNHPNVQAAYERRVEARWRGMT
jgi:hypothetical protein